MGLGVTWGSLEGQLWVGGVTGWAVAGLGSHLGGRSVFGGDWEVTGGGGVGLTCHLGVTWVCVRLGGHLGVT